MTAGPQQRDDSNDAAVDSGAADSGALLDLLRRPEAYPHRPPAVELRETHISWVFLAGEEVFKLKKPVRFDFLDFSTPALRRSACEAEVELNRRLAGDVYLGLTQVTRDANGVLQLDGAGEPVDWLVHMRRLHDEHALDRRIAEGRLEPRQVDKLADLLTAFYRRQPRLEIAPEEYVRQIAEHVDGNRRAMLAADSGLDQAAVCRANAAQLRLLRTREELLKQRVREGRVVDGHGDLRPEHVYLNHTATVIDCIEFSAEFRQIDVLDELGFLAMECDDLGAAEVGRRVIEHYRGATGDTPPEALLPFYKSYRACVRAKVISLRAQQLDGGSRQREQSRAADHLRLADRYAAEIATPLVLVVRGLSGTGKSTLAAHLGEQLGIDVLSSDAVRRELFGAHDAPAEYGLHRYSAANRERVYDELHRRAAALLAQRLSVILDATYLSAARRSEAVERARKGGATALVVHCRCPRDVARQRMTQRFDSSGSLSEARLETRDRQEQEEQPDAAGLPAVEVDTTLSIAEQAGEVYRALGE